ncbi:Sucrase/ferredoxin-like-domain-containing protein [Mycena floridula]|nr:Sucrase/ferredoxin-like-domain-containing protein [Mycena floridula]
MKALLTNELELQLCHHDSYRFYSTAPKSIIGTTPVHSSYIFLHSPAPPHQFPSRMQTTVSMALLSRSLGFGGLVNWSWFGTNPPKSVEMEDSSSTYSATAFSAAGRLVIPELSLDNLEQVSSRLADHAQALAKPWSQSETVDIYVCTHGARECFCGSVGGEVVKALQEQIRQRRQLDPSGPIHRIRVGEIGHVGGHYQAANMLIYPQGEWLGLIHPQDVPEILDKVLDLMSNPFDKAFTKPLSLRHYRGRMGLTTAEQKSLHSNFLS